MPVAGPPALSTQICTPPWRGAGATRRGTILPMRRSYLKPNITVPPGADIEGTTPSLPRRAGRRRCWRLKSASWTRLPRAPRLGGDQAECGGGCPPPPRRVQSLCPGERRRESCRRSWRLRSASWTRLPRAPRPSARLKTRCNRKEIGCRCTGSRGGGASENN